VSVVGTMNKRYEVVSAPGEPAPKLILLEGTWESLPFEIRLSRPWRQTTLCAEAALTGLQREEIAQRGYSIGHATFMGELISNQSGVPIANAGSTRPMTPIEVQPLASADDRAILKGMRRSIQELANAKEQSRGLIVEPHDALRTELTCRPGVAPMAAINPKSAVPSSPGDGRSWPLMSLSAYPPTGSQAG
jgi:hypothetical protein